MLMPQFKKKNVQLGLHILYWLQNHNIIADKTRIPTCRNTFDITHYTSKCITHFMVLV